MKSIRGLTATLTLLISLAAADSFAREPNSTERRMIDLLTDRMISVAEPLGRMEHQDRVLEILEKTTKLGEARRLLLGEMLGDECTKYKVVPESCKPSLISQRLENTKASASTGSPGDEGLADAIWASPERSESEKGN